MSGDPLRDLLADASTMAEAMFDPTDEMMAHIIAVHPDGKRDLIACPMTNATEERLFRIGIPKRLRQEGALRWCFFCEAWTASYEAGANMQTVPPKERADRMEVVTFLAEEPASDRKMQAHRQIFRGTTPARLLPLVISTGRSGYVIAEQKAAP